MQTVAQFDPTSATPAPFDTTLGQQASRGQLYVWNESNSAVAFTLAAGKVLTVPPWMGYPITARPFPMPVMSWVPAYTLSIGSAPISLCIVEKYDPDEPLPSQVPISLSSRVNNVGNQGGSGTGNNLINDANPPATEIIESTPSDQGSSSVKLFNDASGFLQVLSAGVLRTILNIVRGNATTGKATVQIGDSGDTSITTFYGKVGAGSSVPASVVGSGYPGANVSGAVASANTATNATNATSAGRLLTSGGSANVDGLQCFDDSPDMYVVPQSNDTNARTVHLQSQTGTGAATCLDLNPDSSTKVYAPPKFTFSGPTVSGALVGMATAGGGTQGRALFTGTTDPGAFAVEGDLWVDG